MIGIKSVRMEFLADANIVVGQSHFIKTVEDLYEAVTTTAPQAKFGSAFNEKFRACLTRSRASGHGHTQCPSAGLWRYVCARSLGCLSH